MMKSSCWKYYQPNVKDLKDEYGDCVVRAITKALGVDWLSAFDMLVPYARDMQCIPNSRSCYEKLFADNDFKYEGISNKKGSKRPTVQSFSRQHKEGTYVLT